METEFQYLSFQVWLLHTLRAVLFAIISEVAVKKCKTPLKAYLTDMHFIECPILIKC